VGSGAVKRRGARGAYHRSRDALRSVRLEDTGDPRGSSAVLAGTAEGWRRL